MLIRPLFLDPDTEKEAESIGTKLGFFSLSHPFIPVSMVWTGLLKPMRNLVLQTYFADVFVDPWRCGQLPFPLSVLLQEY